MYVCLCVHAHAHAYMCRCVCVRVHVCACVCACVCVRACVYQFYWVGVIVRRAATGFAFCYDVCGCVYSYNSVCDHYSHMSILM